MSVSDLRIPNGLNLLAEFHEDDNALVSGRNILAARNVLVALAAENVLVAECVSRDPRLFRCNLPDATRHARAAVEWCRGCLKQRRAPPNSAAKTPLPGLIEECLHTLKLSVRRALI